MFDMTLPRHVFVSYSRQDSDVANAVVADLDARGIETWIDKNRLAPGTPNWEKTIRSAVQRSFAVLYLASPNSRDSEAVSGELQLAKHSKQLILPALISGEWADVARLDMANTQFVDIRSDGFKSGLDQITEVVRRKIGQAVPNAVVINGSAAFQLDDLVEQCMRLGLGRHWKSHIRVVLPNNAIGIIRATPD